MTNYQMTALGARHPVRLVDTRAFECRWIEGPADADAVCCGAPTDGGSWCQYHRERVFDRRTSLKPAR
jgi:hypothetical protein